MLGCSGVSVDRRHSPTGAGLIFKNSAQFTGSVPARLDWSAEISVGSGDRKATTVRGTWLADWPSRFLSLGTPRNATLTQQRERSPPDWNFFHVITYYAHPRPSIPSDSPPLNSLSLSLFPALDSNSIDPTYDDPEYFLRRIRYGVDVSNVHCLFRGIPKRLNRRARDDPRRNPDLSLS